MVILTRYYLSENVNNFIDALNSKNPTLGAKAVICYIIGF
jgi:hypothetical protein